MIYEYAISPALFNSEDRVALLVTSLGMEHGRLVSDYPKGKWEQLVRQVIKNSSLGDAQRKTWTECLISLRRQGVVISRMSPTWDSEKTWVDNAVDEHQRSVFRAIVDEKPHHACREVVSIGVPLATSALWEVKGSQHVARQASVMVNQMKGLLDISRSIVLIDRNFLIDGRFTNVLSRLAAYVESEKMGPRVTQIKYVVSDQNYQSAELERRCKETLPALLPSGVSVKFFVKQKSKLHDRFVLTELGGLYFGQGLDEGQGDVLVNRLGYVAWAKEWGEWNKDIYHSFEIVRQMHNDYQALHRQP